MKLPNGYGSITKINKPLRKPYRVQKTMGWVEENRKKKIKENERDNDKQTDNPGL